MLLSVSECVGLARCAVFAKMFFKIAFPIVLYHARKHFYICKLTEEIVLFFHFHNGSESLCVCFNVFRLYSKLNKMFLFLTFRKVFRYQLKFCK